MIDTADFILLAVPSKNIDSVSVVDTNEHKRGILINKVSSPEGFDSMMNNCTNWLMGYVDDFLITGTHLTIYVSSYDDIADVIDEWENDGWRQIEYG